MFGSDENGPKEVAKRLGVEWPPEFWAAFRTNSTGALSVLLITKDEVVYGYMCLPLAGAKATVDIGAGTSPARAWLVKERPDSPQLILTIEGRGDPIVIAMRQDHEAIARSTAATINALVGPTGSSGSANHDSVPDQIRVLAALRDHGIISNFDFDAETADLLAASGPP